MSLRIDVTTHSSGILVLFISSDTTTDLLYHLFSVYRIFLNYEMFFHEHLHIMANAVITTLWLSILIINKKGIIKIYQQRGIYKILGAKY